ncbi:RDD family protein [Neolewinella xylanilytica]|uniref:RDD family protein n=1 Tax=Neolewinella xylanilytica TaxID=1514080 RepID=A0A2S6I0N7_9BACT|nr:RDD family protein [Neolewinella xylanilytica]PPK84337.1 RDD family protein [Neolewinella xylanilytica]
MNVCARYLIYLVDCLVMLFVIGLQFLVFRGELPFDYDSESWLRILLDGGNVGLVTLLGGTLYWSIVDYHDELKELRRSTIISSETGEEPEMATRVVRSGLKAFTLFTFPVLLVFALFSENHRFLHDYVAKTERVKLNG